MLIIKQKQLDKLRYLRGIARFLSLLPGATILILTWVWTLIGAPGGHGDEQEWGVIAFYLFVFFTGVGITLMLIGAIAWRWPIVGGSIFLCIGFAICWGAMLDRDWTSAIGSLILFTAGLLNLTFWWKARIINTRWD